MKEYKISEKEVEIIQDEIRANAKSLVGISLKRMEVLEQEVKEGKLTLEQIPNLYRLLVKELIYENSRFLKKIISLHLTTNNLTFTQPKE